NQAFDKQKEQAQRKESIVGANSVQNAYFATRSPGFATFNALGNLRLARTSRVAEADAAADILRSLEKQLRTSSNDYWATQVNILTREVAAWSAQAANKPKQAQALMRAASDAEDATEKLPVTPGPVLPAREQLGYLLLAQHRPCVAAKEFATSLVSAP